MPRHRRSARKSVSSDRASSDAAVAAPVTRRRLSAGLAFGLLCLACLTITVGYASLAWSRSPLAARVAPAGERETADPAVVAGQPAVLFRSTALDPDYGAVVLAPLVDGARPRSVTGLHCERVYFAAARGLCLDVDRGIVTTARVVTFDDHFRSLNAIPLKGIPSRARLSPDGGVGATTTFVSGHSYAGDSFSTETTLLDVTRGVVVGTLEEFAVWRDGVRIDAPDRNFWGVTFARDGDRFYATLATGGKTYLVAGSIAERALRTIHSGVECPSLSPDETRVAFKRRVETGGPIHWQPYVLDLATMTETPLAETRSIDDQIEWLDDQRILYALPESTPSAITHVWMLPADGTGQPSLFLSEAASPVVVRSSAGPPRAGEPAPHS